MIIGVPKEIKEQEYRVAMLLSGAYQLVKGGHQVVVERGAGAGAGYPDPVFVEEGVTQYCVANMPGAYARTAAQALTNVTGRFVEILADHGLAEACQRQPALRSGINVMDGKIVHQAVAEAHALPFSKPTV